MPVVWFQKKEHGLQEPQRGEPVFSPAPVPYQAGGREPWHSPDRDGLFPIPITP